MPATAAGKNYRIREPAELNRWKGRTLRFWVNGGTYNVAITHSDDDTLYFADAGVTVTQGTYYEILEAQPGEVWQWSAASSAWAKPTGTDPRGQPWRQDKRENLPTAVRRFGRMRRGDYITRTVLNQLYAGIDVLRWVRGSFDGWTSRSLANYNSGTPETNEKHNDIGSYDTTLYTCAQARAYYDGLWPMLTIEQGGVPGKEKGTQVGAEWVLTASAKYHYARVTEIPTTRMNHTKSVYLLTGPPAPGVEDNVEPNTLVFDAQGDNVYNGKWSLLATTPPSTTAIVHVKVGSHDLPPNWGREPVPPTAPDFITDGHNLGWTTVDQVVILKWDVSGGLAYVS